VPNLGQSVPVRWLIAIVAFPLGGFLGHAIGGPASTIPAALLSGAVAGLVIGLSQGLALHLRSEALVLWTAVTAIGLAAGMAVVTALIGQIATTPDAVALGAASGIVLGVGQAVVLKRGGLLRSSWWVWVLVSTAAWSAGWLVTASVGVSLAPGWPVYGLSGAVVSQLITGIAVWRLMAPRPEVIPAPL